MFSLHRPRIAHAASALPFGADADEQTAVEGLPGRPFKTLAVTTVVTTFGLVVLGGVVRLTDSGLGCPDWPLCHGQLIPPADKATLIEYSHRLLASVVGVLAVATTVVVWLKWRRMLWMSVPAAVGVVLLVGQGVLGGFTVLRELPGELVLAHLATAELLIACYLIIALAALRHPAPGAMSGLWQRQVCAGGVGDSIAQLRPDSQRFLRHRFGCGHCLRRVMAPLLRSAPGPSAQHTHGTPFRRPFRRGWLQSEWRLRRGINGL